MTSGHWMNIEKMYSVEKLTHYLRTKAVIPAQCWEKWTACKRRDELCSQNVSKVLKKRRYLSHFYVLIFCFLFSQIKNGIKCKKRIEQKMETK